MGGDARMTQGVNHAARCLACEQWRGFWRCEAMDGELRRALKETLPTGCPKGLWPG